METKGANFIALIGRVTRLCVGKVPQTSEEEKIEFQIGGCSFWPRGPLLRGRVPSIPEGPLLNTPTPAWPQTTEQPALLRSPPPTRVSGRLLPKRQKEEGPKTRLRGLAICWRGRRRLKPASAPLMPRRSARRSLSEAESGKEAASAAPRPISAVSLGGSGQAGSSALGPSA